MYSLARLFDECKVPVVDNSKVLNTLKAFVMFLPNVLVLNVILRLWLWRGSLTLRKIILTDLTDVFPFI